MGSSRAAAGHDLANKGKRLAGLAIFMADLAFTAARSASSTALRQFCQRSWSKAKEPGKFPLTAFHAAVSRVKAIAYSSSRFTVSITTPKLLVTERCNTRA